MKRLSVFPSFQCKCRLPEDANKENSSSLLIISLTILNTIKILNIGTFEITTLLFNYQKADNKIFVCKFSKNVKSMLYHTENSKTRGQTVQI